MKFKHHKHVPAAGTLGFALILTGCGNASDDSGSSSFNKADIGFAQQMIPHHGQAVEMAGLAPSRASDPMVKSLASDIRAAQGPEKSRR